MARLEKIPRAPNFPDFPPGPGKPPGFPPGFPGICRKLVSLVRNKYKQTNVGKGWYDGQQPRAVQGRRPKYFYCRPWGRNV